MDSRSIRVGIIGCGYWGPNLIRNFSDLRHVELVAIADMNAERLRHLQSIYPKTQMVVDYQQFFSMGLDAVVIATPPATHFTIASNCLRHNLHVLVEKPLTLRSCDAEELVDLAEEHGRILMVGNTFEYNPAVIALKEIIASGELGEIYYINAVRTNLGLYQPNVNAMWDLAPHDISILLYLLGQDPTTVSAQGGASVFRHIHDVVYMHLRFNGRMIAHIHVSWLDPCKVRRVTIVGSRKMAVYDDVENLEKVRIYDRGVDTPPYTDSFGEFQCSYRYGDIVTPHIPFVEPLRVECEHFVNCVLNSVRPKSDGVVGLRIVKILEAASRSLAEDGRSYDIPATRPERMPPVTARPLEAAVAAAK